MRIQAKEIKNLVSSSETRKHQTKTKETSETKGLEDVLHSVGIVKVSKEVETENHERDHHRESPVKMLIELSCNIEALEDGERASEGRSDSSKDENNGSCDKRLPVECWNAGETELGQTSLGKLGSETNKDTGEHEVEHGGSFEENSFAFEWLEMGVFNLLEAVVGSNEGSNEEDSCDKAGSPFHLVVHCEHA